MKKLLAAALTIVMLLSFAPASLAATVIDSGTCGINLTWSLDSDGTLTISGNGIMTSNPWRPDHYHEIRTVIIENGATSMSIREPCPKTHQ